ncbi:MAG: hypothetical protein IJB95_04365, partial [Clostridia bacterium]|nr:hypothetical protein [Clostridia bacterium]
WDAYVTCSRCDYTTYEEKAALGHDEVAHEAQAPTCTAIGWDAYVTCSRCDYTTKVEKAALGHTWTDATCTAPKTCSVCGATEDEANGHTAEALPGKDATCEEKGLTEGSKCSVCGTVLVAQEEIAANGHDLTQHEAQAPTCTEIGWSAYENCSKCDHTTYVEIPALGHAFEYVDANINYHTAECTRCDAEITKDDEESKHVYDKEDNTKCACGKEKPTSTKENTETISIANYADSNNWQDATKYTTINIGSNITVTATGGGNTGKYYINGENWRLYQGENATVKITASNGATIVSVKITYSSSNSGTLKHNGAKVTSGSTVTVNAESITFAVGNTGSATNGQARITAIEVIYSTTTTRECAHSEDGKAVTEVTTPATCTADGFITYTCTYCEKTWTETTETALGHQFAVVVGEYTDDVHTVKCGRCGEIEERPHDFATKQSIVDDDVYHNIICECGKTKQEEHVWNEDHTCDCTHPEPRLIVSVNADERVDYELSISNPYAGESVTLTIDL